MNRPIPEVRADLQALAVEMESGQIEPAAAAQRVRDLANALFRERPVRTAPVTAVKMTEAMADSIRRYAEAHPTMSQPAIGLVFGVNQGRVSEAMNWKR